jgi:signal transduction histidine kinase
LIVSLAAIAVVVPVLLSAPPGTRSVAIPIFVAGAAVTFGVGLYDLARGRDLRFARILIFGGVLWSLSALTASAQPTPHSVGRVSQWLVELAVIYVLLSYPSGRLTTRLARRLFAFAALLVALLYLPTALIAQQYPNPAPWSRCTVGCAHNVFALSNSTPAVVSDVIAPLRELLTVALIAVVAAVAVQRSRHSGALVGRMCVPIAAIAVVQVVILAVYFSARAASPMSVQLHVLSWVYVMSLPTVALAAAAGWPYRRLVAAKALGRIARGLRRDPTPAQVGLVVAGALNDPSLQIFHSFPEDAGVWVDESGTPVPLPDSGSAHAVTEVTNGRWRLAIVHDPALAEDPALVETAGSYALAALENDQLSGALHSSLEELAEARAFGVTAERREREKIERDIHDGAQQRLVALRLKIALAADQIGGLDTAGADALHALEADIDAAIEEVRSFARGVYPAMLAEMGLASALRTLGRGTTLPTVVVADGLGRYSHEIETTVYFSCSEALQNAAKHARGATSATVRVWDDGDLRFEVRDDGCGFDAASTPRGSGLSNLGDRLVSIDGTITLRSAPGRGTSVQGVIPTAAGGAVRVSQPGAGLP